jgi:hypothetical protein
MSIKSYLINGRSSAYSLVSVSQDLCKEQVQQNVEEMAKQAIRARHDFLSRPWLGALPLRVSYKALDLIVGEYRRAKSAMPSTRPSQSIRRPLEPCHPDTCTATIQYNIPCRHDIYKKLAEGERLELREVHTHWHLQMSLIERDKYLEIQEPKIVENRKGRPKNSARPLPDGLGIPSSPKTPRSQRRDGTQGSQVSQGRRTPGSIPGPPRGNAPRLQPSIRRVLSAHETVEEPRPPQAAPKRRGRPPGSKNKKKDQAPAPAESQLSAAERAEPRTTLVIASAPRRGLRAAPAAETTASENRKAQGGGTRRRHPNVRGRRPQHHELSQTRAQATWRYPHFQRQQVRQVRGSPDLAARSD